MAGGLIPRGNRGGRLKRYGAVHEINVTPFVDVMLVLLIVFMISAPLMTQGVQVSLPETSAAPIQEQEDPIQVTVRRDGSFYLEQRRVEEADLLERLQAIQKVRPKASIILRADKTVSYGRVMQVMSALQTAGLTDVGLVTEPPQSEF